MTVAPFLVFLSTNVGHPRLFRHAARPVPRHAFPGASRGRCAALLFALLALSACGTISRGPSSEVAIEVTPPDATVRTSLDVACIGSCRVRAPRNRDFTVTASAPGYESRTVAVRRRVTLAGAGGVARNALGGPTMVGVGVDLYTGAAFDHVPNPVRIDLERSTVYGPSRPGS